jgi:hypothetical protein
MWKEVVVVCPGVGLEGLRKIMKTSVRIAGIRADI